MLFLRCRQLILHVFTIWSWILDIRIILGNPSAFINWWHIYHVFNSILFVYFCSSLQLICIYIFAGPYLLFLISSASRKVIIYVGFVKEAKMKQRKKFCCSWYGLMPPPPSTSAERPGGQAAQLQCTTNTNLNQHK
jgi:hypothetical protein